MDITSLGEIYTIMPLHSCIIMYVTIPGVPELSGTVAIQSIFEGKVLLYIIRYSISAEENDT